MSTNIPFDSSLASMIDHTLLDPEATKQQIAQLCDEARRYGFASVCVNPSYVRLCSERLSGTTVKVCTVVGFPLGASSSQAKAYEAGKAIEDGAQELDMVINIGMLKSGDVAYVESDIRSVVSVAKQHGVITKVIPEAALLTDEEKKMACRLAVNAGADFVKTSTGFAQGGATVEDVRLMREVVGSSLGVKAGGGIRTQSQARSFIDSGANRIGASASIQIVTQQDDAKATAY